MLPTSKTVPATKFEDMITLIYGAPKIGKSTFCAGYENALFLDSEIGLNNLSTYRVPIDCWETFMAIYKELKAQIASGKCQFRPLVFDTIDNLYQYCMDYVCKKNGFNHPSDLEYGKGWNMVRNEFNVAMSAYRALGLGVIYVSHAESTEINSRVGKYTRWDVSMSGQASKAILPTCDFILFAHSIKDEKGNEKRVIETKGSQFWNAGDRTGKLPEQLPFDAKEFMKAFEHAVKGA